MKLYNKSFFVSVIIAIIVISVNVGHGDELFGRVTKAIEKQVEIKLEGELLPQIGDEVVIGFNMPSIGFVPLQGRWNVSAINLDTIIADPDGDTRQPQKDQLVKIASPNPLSRKSMEQEAENLFEKAQNYFYGRKGENKNFAKALEFYRKAANMGSLSAMNSIGYMYGTGAGVTKNNAKALKWFRKSADQNYAEAERNLGIMYENGWGVEKDNNIAFEWYFKAAKQGNAKAQRNLGVCYENGKGTALNYKSAVEWYLKAANKGDAVAQSNLGTMYFRGTGIARDYQQAAQWYRKSAGQGHAMAEYNLGVIYDQGRGVPEDDNQAIIWYRKAAQKGDVKAKKALTRLGQ